MRSKWQTTNIKRGIIMENKQYQPKTGARCGCRRGVWRDNCPYCEGTGWTINFKSFHTKTMPEQWMAEKTDEAATKRIKIVCYCITGKKDCPYCKGEGTVWVQVIGTPYREE